MLSDRDFSILLRHLDRPWSGFRKVRRGVKKRVRRHMAELGCSTIDQYLVEISRPPARAACEQCLRVTISRFFRDRHLWQALQARILPELGRRHAPPLRIWSAGCACGEEAYSLAMVCGTLDLSPTPVLVATDDRQDCLRRAREGVYARPSLRELPEEMQKRYVDLRRGGRQAIVRKGRLPPIHWQAHDLTGEPFEGDPFHLILMRNNVLTYYQGHSQQAALSGVLSQLAPGGCLVIGSHEQLPRTGIPLKKDEGCPWVFWLDE